MDFIKLAELLYPNTTQTTDYWIEKYGKRNLSDDAEVTRIAPSPTGFLHIGTAYGAMIDKLIAKNGGVYYFRLEDTDQKREIAESGNIAYQMLCYYDLKPDEGFCGNNGEVGDFAPYKQSERIEIYNSFAKELVLKGRAFPCFCDKADSKAEVEKRRQEELEVIDDISTKDPCRDLTLEDIEKNIKQGKKFALRLYSVGNGEKNLVFNDLIKGEREIKENSKDIVLVKSNGIPVYAFAHAVDDTLMGTTIVVRGEEWYPSVSAHLEIFDALGLKRVKYLHTPVICKLDENGNKRKLSKRRDIEADARYFIVIGMPKIAVIEYLLNLINSDFEIWRTNNPELPYADFPFSISKMGTNNPMFDMVKLSDISKSIISKMTAEEVYNQAFEWAKEFDTKFAIELENEKEYAISVFSIDRGGLKPRKDLAKWSDIESMLGFMFNTYKHLELKSDYELDGVNEENLKEVLMQYEKTIDFADDKQVWFEKIKNMAGYLGYAIDNKDYKLNPNNYKGNVATVCEYIRIALTGRKNSPDIYAIINALGEEKTRERLVNLEKLI